MFMYVRQIKSLLQTCINTCTLLTLLVVPVSTIHAENKSLSADEAQQVHRVKEAVMQELRDSDFLQQQIQLGIKAYILKQQAEQTAAAAAQARQLNERAKNVRRVDAKRDHIYGNQKARVTIIEYSDFDCPYCKSFHATPKKAVDKYDGRVNWVYRHFPLAFHPDAMKLAEASECAADLGGNEAFWKYTDALYARSPSNDKSLVMAKLKQIAETIGLNKNDFMACLNSDRYAARVTEDFEEGSRLGINGTPGSILLNNETGDVLVVSGALPLEAITAKIEQILN